MIKISRRMNESYSDINSENAWEAYDIALEYLGGEELAEALAKAMGTYELADNLAYIFRNYEIPFGDEDFEESVRRPSRRPRRRLESTRRTRLAKNKKMMEGKQNPRFIVKISTAKTKSGTEKYKFECIDNYSDNYYSCIFDKSGQVSVSSESSRKTFNDLYDDSMQPGKVYALFTTKPSSWDVVNIKEVPASYFIRV